MPFNQIAVGGEGFTLICPNCLSEYEEEGATRCEDCEVDLVEAEEEEEGEIEFGALLEVTDADGRTIGIVRPAATYSRSSSSPVTCASPVAPAISENP